MPDSLYDDQNIFARILRGELPCIKVYEDAQTFAFMDIMPQTRGHVLVLPKEAAVQLFDLSEEAACATLRTTRKVARAVRAALSPDGLTITQFNGSAAGQTVPHVHFHILPRYHGQPLHAHAHARADQAELGAQAARIIAALDSA